MRAPDRRIPIAVTGMGMICSIGRNCDEVWSSIVHSRAGIASLTRFPGETFPTSMAAEVAANPPGIESFSPRSLRRLSRSDRLAAIAAFEALAQADRADVAIDRSRAFVSTGSSTGGLLEGEDYFFQRLVRGKRKTRPSIVLQQQTSGPSDAVAGLLGLGGGVSSNATACASAGGAIGLAADLLRAGHCDSAVAGGSDALCRLTYSGFNVLQAVDADPCRPFDEERSGITLGEGAAYLVLERERDAMERGAPILAMLGGWGASCDAHHPTAPAEDGRGAAAAMREALADAGVSADEVDYVNAHGTGTLLNDSAECRAIASVIGRRAPISSTKSFFGHTLGASGLSRPW